jgi:hypothetical protein
VKATHAICSFFVFYSEVTSSCEPKHDSFDDGDSLIDSD